MRKDAFYAPAERASILWICALFPGFGRIVTALVTGYFQVLKRPTKNIQPYSVWANKLVELLLQANKAEFLESENCRATLVDIGKRGFFTRAACLYCAYMFAQARIVFDECTNSRRLQRSLERLLLQAITTVRARLTKQRIRWESMRLMRAAEAASGKHPRSIHVLNQICVNRKWEKLSDVFDDETGLSGGVL